MAENPDGVSDKRCSKEYCPSPEGDFGPGGTEMSGAKKVNLRVEIDTSPPFGSVKEAVTHFEGSGSWFSLHGLGLGLRHSYLQGVGEVDLKKVEEQTLELEKNLIVKELETLDVLEELGTTKRIVEDLKWQLQHEALKSMTVPEPQERMPTPISEDMNKENHKYILSNCEQAMGTSSLCPSPSPDLILMELNQAKLNLGKTIHELGLIQTSVECLNKKIKKEKALLEKTRQRLTSKPAGASSLKEEPERQRMKPLLVDDADLFGNYKNVMELLPDGNYRPEQYSEVDEARDFGVSRAVPSVQQMNASKKTAEMRLIAARKMEEAARAAEAVALAEIKALSNNEGSFNFLLPEPDNAISFLERPSPFNSKTQNGVKAQTKYMGEALSQNDGANTPKVAILKKLEDATEEVKFSQQALEEALNRVEIANKKQLAAGEALRKWTPKHDQRGAGPAKRVNLSNPSDHPRNSPLVDMRRPDLADEEPKPVLRPTVSMRDVLSRKQVLPEEYVARRQSEGQRVALSQMLNELREDLTFPSKAEGNRQKQFLAQRKKFGFIHISLPLTKHNKKNVQPSDLR
ncbi:WEB family protein At2g40480 isoform X1 [Syzygium oleosum]|uniref:WEB family protein At2g40480 isoform X1 n=1 Tax=Syzygium oleosum TaxID=219896 RepID=UPI0011D1DF9E|nr:WEB family protein At2g40480 isoform X1 [Syzygium oleosum]